jgi:hypothetical protein
MSCADFTGTLFLVRDAAHSTHLNTHGKIYRWDEATLVWVEIAEGPQV